MLWSINQMKNRKAINRERMNLNQKKSAIICSFILDVIILLQFYLIDYSYSFNMNCYHFLAMRAKMRSSASHFNLLQDRPTTTAPISILPVDPKTILILPCFVVRAERSKSSSLVQNRPINDLLPRLQNGPNFIRRQFITLSLRMDSSLEQDLVRVYIPDSTYDFLLQQQFFYCFTALGTNLDQIFFCACIGIIYLGSQFRERRMLHLLSPFNQMHSAKLSDIVVNDAVSVRQQKLNMVVFFWSVFFVVPNVFSLHSKVGNNGIVLEFQNEKLAIAVNVFEGLSDETVDEDCGLGLFDYARIKGLYRLYFQRL